MRRIVAGFIGVWTSIGSLVAQTERLEISPTETGEAHELSWAPRIPRWTGTPLEMRYQVYQSNDLEKWEPVGAPLMSADASELSLELAGESPQRYYRLESAAEFKFFDKNSGTVASYGDQRDLHFNELKDLSVGEFEEMYESSVAYRDQIDWDVTKAHYWDQFAMSHGEHNSHLAADDPDRRLYDFRLNDSEIAMMQKNGFVVTSRLQRNTFVDLFYDIWTDDLPVYFSTDAALQAWHRSYQVMLEELEELELRRKLIALIGEMRAEFPAVWESHRAGPLGEGLRDADFFLAIAESLINGERATPYLSEQQDKVEMWRDWIEAHEELRMGGPFGTAERYTDFSQFTVRGHYANSPTLGRYFQAMTWLGRVDFRMGGGDPEPGSLRQLGGAVSLSLLLKQSDQLGVWESFEEVLSTFVGLSDSMTPPQMLALLEAEDLGGFDKFDQSEVLADLQQTLLLGPYGLQEVSGHPIKACGTDETVLPRSFTFFGQRFTPDSWVLAEVTYNRLPFARRFPSSLDTAFGVFDNRAVVPLIASQIRDDQGMPFRDGLPYQPYLAAAHQTLQTQEPLFWETNFYQGWLGALRTLSSPTTSDLFPQSMQTEAWAMKNLNTQLASWTQLRHDTILYTKQSYTPPFLCDYPAGYVEPRVPFWESMAKMATSAGAIIDDLDMQGIVDVERLSDFGPVVRSLDLAERKQLMVAHFTFFADVMSELAEISRLELAREPLTADQAVFMKSLIEDVEVDYVGSRTYSGWYPNLYFKGALIEIVTRDHPSDLWDPLVVDVHTDSPAIECHGNGGGVLHEAVGNVDFMMLGVNHSQSGCVYAGPVFSYYEMVEPFPKRLTDGEWKTRVEAGELPPRPKWTEIYLGP